MLGMLVAWLLGIACIGMGNPVVRYLDKEECLTIVETTAISFLVGSLLSFLLIWGVGVFELSRSTMIPLGVFFILASAPGNIYCFKKITHEIRAAKTPDGPFFYVLMAMVLVLVSGMIINAFAPPADSDAVRYHLLLPQRDIEFGKIQSILGWSLYDFFPAAIETLYRFGMVLSDMRSAHHIHVLYVLASGALTWALARRIKLSETVAMSAVVMFLSVRVVMYQSSTADIDLSLTATSTALFILLLSWREAPNYRLIILMGLVAGLAPNIKYNGIVLLGIFGLITLWSSFRLRVSIMQVVTFSLVVVLLYSPFLIKNFYITGNPVFPLFNELFGENRIDPLLGVAEFYRKEHGFGGFFIAPVTMFLFPDNFDGIQFGGVIFLIFLPFVWLERKNYKRVDILLVFLLLFYVAWYWLMALEVRFLHPAFPVLGVLSALGAAILWKIAQPYKATRYAFIFICLISIGNQLMFYVGTAIRRWPVAFGLKTEASYLNSPPFILNTHLEACAYIRKNLKDDETYLNMLDGQSVYCPQKSTLVQLVDTDIERIYTNVPFRKVKPEEIVSIIKKNKIRFVVGALPITGEDPSVMWDFNRAFGFYLKDFNNKRFLDVLRPGLINIKPEVITATAQIYDARALSVYLSRNNP